MIITVIIVAMYVLSIFTQIGCMWGCVYVYMHTYIYIYTYDEGGYTYIHIYDEVVYSNNSNNCNHRAARLGLLSPGIILYYII